MEAHDIVTRRQFLVTGAAGAAVLATARDAAAQAPAQKFQVKPHPVKVG